MLALIQILFYNYILLEIKTAQDHPTRIKKGLLEIEINLPEIITNLSEIELADEDRDRLQ